MRQFLALSLCVLMVAGCGTNIGDPVAGRVTFADAREACIGIATGFTFNNNINVRRADREAGFRETEILLSVDNNCREECDLQSEFININDCFLACRECFTTIITAVYDE